MNPLNFTSSWEAIFNCPNIKGKKNQLFLFLLYKIFSILPLIHLIYYNKKRRYFVQDCKRKDRGVGGI